LDLFEKLVVLPKHQILLINDNPYSFVLNDNPMSLQVNGAKEVALELNSLSKTFNMAGWRVGMVLGNAKAIDAILKVKRIWTWTIRRHENAQRHKQLS
jgi:aspartate/methionine/tyrosine aminotransferase